MRVEKKTWPELFELVLKGKKNFDLRLADFDLKEGDILVLKEFDPKAGKFSGRSIEKKCKNVVKVNPFEFHSAGKIKKFGLYLIELK